MFVKIKEAISFMKLIKRAAAALLSVCTALTCASCGENTATAMTIDGYDVRAGIYLYYVTTAYNDAIQVLSDGGESFDDCETTADIRKIMKKVDIDEITAEEWIQNKAVEYCQTFVAIEKEFDALGLTLSGEDLANIENGVASSMSYFGEFFEDTGIGEQTVKDIVTSSYKESMLWDAYYGEGGSVGIKESELYDNFKNSHLRIKYIEMPLKDGEGNLLKADGKAKMEEMAEDYLARLAKKADSEADLMEEFDYLIEEHAAYQTSVSEAAVTTTDDEGNVITTETTAKVTTTDPAAEETTTDETDLTGETTTTTTTTETTAAAEDITDTTTATGETETTTTTTAASGSLGYDTSHEVTLIVSTATSADPLSTETTTEPTYTPCEKVYTWAADDSTPYNSPTLIKDEETYYVVMKMDIEDRMTEDDLWTSSAQESVRQSLYYDEFEDMMDEKGDALSVTRNEKAFRRYHVLDVDVVGYQNALWTSYYSSYGLSY